MAFYIYPLDPNGEIVDADGTRRTAINLETEAGRRQVQEDHIKYLRQHGPIIPTGNPWPLTAKDATKPLD